MIQKSDLFILVFASAGLAVGIFRWHNNTQNVSSVTIPASSKVVIPAPEMPPEPTSLKLSVANQVSTLPADSAVDAQTVTPERVEFMEYTVQPGDYLSKIAVEYDTDVSTLKRLNDLNGTTIHAGQTLVYPYSSNNSSNN